MGAIVETGRIGYNRKMTEYEKNEERYDKLDEATYIDTENDEVVFVLTQEQSDEINRLLAERQAQLDQND